MVRTKGDGAGRAVGAKTLAKSMSSPGASSSRAGSSSGSNDKYSGGNAYCPRPTPPWQKEISAFFTTKPKEPSGRDESGEGSSAQAEGHTDEP